MALRAKDDGRNSHVHRDGCGSYDDSSWHIPCGQASIIDYRSAVFRGGDADVKGLRIAGNTVLYLVIYAVIVMLVNQVLYNWVSDPGLKDWIRANSGIVLICGLDRAAL